jgi:hypothetical protein
MSNRYTLKRFADGAIPIYAVIDPESGHPYTNSNMMPWQSVSPDLLRLVMESVMPGAVEVPEPTRSSLVTHFTE